MKRDRPKRVHRVINLAASFRYKYPRRITNVQVLFSCSQPCPNVGLFVLVKRPRRSRRKVKLIQALDMKLVEKLIKSLVCMSVINSLINVSKRNTEISNEKQIWFLPTSPHGALAQKNIIRICDRLNSVTTTRAFLLPWEVRFRGHTDCANCLTRGWSPKFYNN
jgi:hypothetical protein